MDSKDCQSLMPSGACYVGALRISALEYIQRS
jgi:hypothetical protein